MQNSASTLDIKLVFYVATTLLVIFSGDLVFFILPMFFICVCLIWYTSLTILILFLLPIVILLIPIAWSLADIYPTLWLLHTCYIFSCYHSGGIRWWLLLLIPPLLVLLHVFIETVTKQVHKPISTLDVKKITVDRVESPKSIFIARKNELTYAKPNEYIYMMAKKREGINGGDATLSRVFINYDRKDLFVMPTNVLSSRQGNRLLIDWTDKGLYRICHYRIESQGKLIISHDHQVERYSPIEYVLGDFGSSDMPNQNIAWLVGGNMGYMLSVKLLGKKKSVVKKMELLCGVEQALEELGVILTRNDDKKEWQYKVLATNYWQ